MNEDPNDEVEEMPARAARASAGTTQSTSSPGYVLRGILRWIHRVSTAPASPTDLGSTTANAAPESPSPRLQREP
jgi:hypothetical protein